METQPEATLIEFIRYNLWANQQLLAACLNLSESQLTAAIPGAYGSVRDTVHHLLRAEADYIGRITGARPQPAFNWEAGPSLAEMSAFAAQVGAAFLDTVQRVPPTQTVHEEEDGKTMDYQARQLFMQVVNHGIEHRTNITTFLSQQGLPVPELDNWGYMWAHPSRFEVKEGAVTGE
ncbi:MAG: DinB family protein [Anaerolineales bacterium]|nr:DinB family protein [Anaerolineales bacterium]